MYVPVYVVAILCMLNVIEITPLQIKSSKTSITKEGNRSSISCVNGDCVESSKNVVYRKHCVDGVCTEEVFENSPKTPERIEPNMRAVPDMPAKPVRPIMSAMFPNLANSNLFQHGAAHDEDNLFASLFSDDDLFDDKKFK